MLTSFLLAVLSLFSFSTCEVLAVDIFGEPTPREINFKPSELAILADALSEAGDEEKTAFARIALREMAAVYEAELARAQEVAPKTDAGRKKLARWRFATRRYLAELRDISAVLESSGAPRIHVDKQQRVLLFVGEHPVIITGPRIGRKPELEKRIKEEFCLFHECTALLETESEAEPAPVYPPKGTWSLGRNRRPRYETVDGLLFEFSDISNRARKEQACLAVIPELRELAAALKMAREAGYAVDWRGIALEPIPASEEHRVMLNPRGDYLRLSLPRLEATRDFWRDALPWLRVRAEGKHYRVRFLNSERLLVKEDAKR